MANINQTSGSGVSSLEDFTLDDGNDDFFGIKTKEDTKTSASTVTKEVKGSTKAATSGTKVGEIDDIEDDDDSVTFFADEEPAATTKPNKKKVEAVVEEEKEEEDDVEEEKEEEEKEVKTKKKKKKEVDTEDDDEEEVEEVTDTKEEIDKDEEDKKFFSTLAEEMKDKKIFQNVEIPKGEITEDKFFELHDAEIEARVDEAVEAFAEGFDNDAKDFISFKKNGGKTADFFNVIAKDINLDKFNPDNAKQVEQVNRHYLSVFEGLDEDDVEDRIAWLKENKKDVTKATEYFDKIKAKVAKEKELILKDQEDRADKQEKASKKFVEDIATVVSETDAVSSIPITKTDQRELPAYITKPVVKVGKNSYIPQLHADITAILNPKNKEQRQKLIALAKILKNNFELKDLTKAAATEATQRVKSNLRKVKDGGVVGKTSGSSNNRRGLADYFN